MEDFVRKRLANLQPDNHLRWLLSHRWQAIFTTNYDSCIQRAYELNEKPIQNPKTIRSSSELVSYDPRLDVPIFHLHGALFDGGRGIVITEDDYSKFRETRKMLFSTLKEKFATSPILYIGYSNRDPNWKLVLSELSSEFYPSIPHRSYRVDPNSDDLDIENLMRKGIETIPATFENFALAVSAMITSSEIDPDRFKKVKVPSQLKEAFDKSPAAVIRLLASWTYVNQAPFSDNPNTTAFLSGNRPNWALIGLKHHFNRDIEEEIYDDVLDYVTSSPKKPRICISLGAAGYGITTILMSIAVKFVQEGVGPVFMHKIGTPIAEGDVLFATSLFPNPAVFLIDDAADNAIALQSTYTQLLGNNKPSIMILGERLNEWRQRKAKIRGKEYIVEALSDNEINCLLDCLTRHHALNKLESLEHEMRIAVIKKNHSKELLVAMKEATEGKGFDAILEGEFRGIKDEFARSLYLTVCCFYQHGAYIRDNALANTLDVDVTTLYTTIGDTLDGVVIFDCIDEGAEIQAARARHRTIATIVWERCGELTKRDHILLKALSSLNLNFRADVIAFERLIRSDYLIDGLRGLENKTQFFETACKKDPESPYVRQHYARMLSREKRPELALLQIDEAFKVAVKPPPRILYHTKGTILMTLVIDPRVSESIARRKLVLSEDEFRKAMNLNPKDEYAYQGLASLYLGWAKRLTNDEESAEYISKAEEVITSGLQKVKDRESLYILTSEIAHWLGDKPSSVKALEQAVLTNPGSFIARYLLGRTYRLEGKPDKTLEILIPVVNGTPDEYRALIEYALALLEIGKSIEQAVAILNMGKTFGLNDPRFVATLGGMLFIKGDFEESKKVFYESERREFPYLEAREIYFKPSNSNGSGALQMSGKVTVVRPSYAFIESEGHSRFICQSSKFLSKQLQVGMRVHFSSVRLRIK